MLTLREMLELIGLILGVAILFYTIGKNEGKKSNCSKSADFDD